jgi:hypothetical protein
MPNKKHSSLLWSGVKSFIEFASVEFLHLGEEKNLKIEKNSKRVN